MRNKKRKPMKLAVILIYAVAAAGLLYSFHPFVHALGRKTVTIEIGAGDNRVEAALSGNGTLTISGEGRTGDYTEETAPFAEYADRITAVKIGDGVTSIGSCLFYNCGNLKGRLSIPDSVIWIGDSAFSGDSAERAPKFSIVESKFTEREIGLPKPGTELPGKPDGAEKPSPATPGNALGDQGETTEAASTPSEAEKGPGEQTEESGKTSENPTEAEETTGPSETVKEPESVPERVETEEALETEKAETSDTEKASEPFEKTDGQEEAGEFTAFSGRLSQGLRRFTWNASDKAANAEDPALEGQIEDTETGTEAEDTEAKDTEAKDTETQDSSAAETTAEHAEAPESQPITASSSTADDQEPDEDTEPTEEDSEDGVLTNNLYDGAVEAAALDENQREFYTFETITSQITGTEIFYTGQKGTYECTEENTGFADAAIQAGYRKADRFIEVDMEGIRESLPVIDGKLYSPELPEGFPVPEDTGDPLFTECFSGWTLESDWTGLGYEAPVYAPGEAITIEEETRSVSLYGNWEKTFRITPGIRVQTDKDLTTYTLIDSESGGMIPETDGYRLDYQWQVCQTEDSSADSVWRDIEGADTSVYIRISEPEDTERYFRAQITIQRQSPFRSATEPVTVFSEPVQGEKEMAKITVSYEAGDGGTGTPPASQIIESGDKLSPSMNTFTRAADDGKVFTGWLITLNGVTAFKPSGTEVGNGSIADGNDVALTLKAAALADSPSVTFTAQWGTATVVYVSNTGDDTNNTGTKDSPFKTLGKAYSVLPDSGSAQTNVVELLTGYAMSNSYWENLNTHRNLTLRGQGKSATKITLPLNRINQQGDMIFENLTIACDRDTLFMCNGYNVTFHENTALTNSKKFGSGGADSGVTNDTPMTHLLAKHNESFPSTAVYGPHGTSADDPIRIVLSDPDVGIGRLACEGRNMTNNVTTADSPVYTEVTLNRGSVGLFIFGGITDESNYLHGTLNVNGGSIYNIAGGNNGYASTSVTTGSISVNMTDGHITTLNGGPLGRRNSKYANTVADVSIDISGGSVDTIYMGGSTGTLVGNIMANITGGTIGTFYGGGYGYSQFVPSGSYHDGAARITGDVTTVISGGTFSGNVYAGGRGYKSGSTTGSAIIDGNTTLMISGDANIQGSVFGAGQGLSNDATAGKVLGNSTVTISGGTIAGNVYGGGEIGSLDGSVTVNILPGANIQGTIFGGGNTSGSVGSTVVNLNAPLGTAAQPKNIYGAGNGSGTSVTGEAAVNVGVGARIFGNVFGGGEAGSAGTTSLLLQGGTITGDVFGGGNQADVNGAVSIIQKNGSKVNGSIYGGSNSEKTISGQVSIDIAGSVEHVYGGGLGEPTAVEGGTRLTISDGASVTGNVYGGGALGSISESMITLQGGTVEGNVYGSGNEAGAAKTVIQVPATAGVKGSIYGGSNEKGETTETNIQVSGNFNGNIFGGGYGLNTTVKTSKVTALSGAAPTGILYGGGEKGKVENAQVLLSGGSHAASVFGGGSEADVTVSSIVTVESGAAADYLYGGSNNSGTVTGSQLLIHGTAAQAYGGGQGGNTITFAPSVTVENGARVTELYGGGREGVTKNGTALLLKAGSRADQVFGGGNAAGIEGTAAVQLEEGSRVWKVYGGSNSSGTVDQASLTINGTVGGTGTAGTADGPGAVYGGGLGVNTTTVKTGLEIGTTAAVTGEVFGGGAEGPVTGDTIVVLKPSSRITGSVYAGGDAAAVSGSTRLEANDGAVIEGSLYGGGRGKTAEIGTDTRVLAFAHVTGNVFGGGAEGEIKGNTHVDIAKGTIDGDGVNTGNVFGGSDKSYVYGNTQVHIGVEAAAGTGTDVTGASLVIGGSVFGGGNTTDNGSTFDASDPFVKGTATVKIDGTGYQVASFNIGKSILGDGNMCTVKGTRTVTVKGYRAEGDQANTSIQRADILTLDESRVELTGAVDSANLVPTIAYSLNRIDQLIIKGGSTLKIQASVNLVKNLISQDSSGDPVTSTATVDTGAAPSTENHIDIQQGIQMELRTSEDVTTMEYGAVSGYMVLDVYDPEGKTIESGIYVLGNYNADESLGGFLYGSGDDQYKKIDPTTDGATWRNWAIGTNMKKTEILVMSDKPAGGKIVQLESPWPADGSVYRLVEHTAQEPTVTIHSSLADGSNFVLKDPAALDAGDPADTSLGISIRAGSQGWVNPMTMGYITGNSDTGAEGGGFGGLATEPMQTLNNRSTKPTILVELTNRTGITRTDADRPLTVTFQLENVRLLSDGSSSKQGTLTVELQIRREALDTYDDILISAGKEYVRATQTYTFETAAGEAGVTISKQSAVTLQYGKKGGSGESAGDHRLSFTSGDTLTTAGAPVTLPAGVTILAVDRSADDLIYAHYTVPQGGVSEVKLSQFTKNGTSDPYSHTISYYDQENYLFILDFEGAPDFGQEKLCVTFEPIYSAGSSAVAKPVKIVFNVTSTPQNYKISSPEATGVDGEGISYDREAVIPLTLTTYAESIIGIDTTGTGVEMGARLRLKNRDIGAYVPVPTDWFAMKDGKKGELTGGGISVILGSGMMGSTNSIGIHMKPSSLSAGRYQWEIYLTASPLAGYPGQLTGKPLYLNFNITDMRYSIEAGYKDPSASRLYPSVNTGTRLPLELRIKAKSENGAATDGVVERASLWRKDQTTGEYTRVNLDTVFEGLSGAAKDYDWQESRDLSYMLKDTLPEGTYRLKYELIQTGGGADQLLTYDTENFIVIDK